MMRGLTPFPEIWKSVLSSLISNAQDWPKNSSIRISKVYLISRENLEGMVINRSDKLCGNYDVKSRVCVRWVSPLTWFTTRFYECAKKISPRCGFEKQMIKHLIAYPKKSSWSTNARIETILLFPALP